MALSDNERPASPTLEAPPLGSDDFVAGDVLWLYRSKSVQQPRPVLTGDVFLEVPTVGADPAEKNVIVLQHPCALRVDGFNLAPRLLVAEVAPGLPMPKPKDWDGNYSLMPLPKLSSKGEEKHFSGLFDQLDLVAADALRTHKRVACMSQLGIALLMQRFTYHNSRVAVPEWRFRQSFGAQFVEADGIEDWCKTRSAKRVKAADAGLEAHAWLEAENEEGIVRRLLLGDDQYRKRVLRAMTKAAEQLNDDT